MTRRSLRQRGFTLLESVIAISILALALMAIFEMNSGAVNNHVYTKRLTVASLLARSKMVDVEQELFDKGFSNDDDELDGDFSDEGWPSYRWRAKIIVPQTDNVPTDQLLSALFNIPMDGEGGGLAAMFGLGGGGDAAGAAAGALGALGGGAAGAGGAGALAAMGPLAGFAQQQLTQMVQEISKTVREVHVTVSWKDGKNTESIDVVTHVVSSGPGSDRNGVVGPGGSTAPQGVTQWMNPRTQQLVPTPIPCRSNPQAMCDPVDQVTQLVPAPQGGGLGAQGIGGLQGAGGQPGLPMQNGLPQVRGGGIFNPNGPLGRTNGLRPGGQ